MVQQRHNLNAKRKILSKTFFYYIHSFILLYTCVFHAKISLTVTITEY